MPSQVMQVGPHCIVSRWVVIVIGIVVIAKYDADVAVHMYRAIYAIASVREWAWAFPFPFP